MTKPGRVVDPEAYQFVLKGRHFWTQRGEANLAIAEEAFRRALEIDPNFAEAHAGIADVWMIRAWFRAMADGGPAVAEDLERATTAAQRATELDPGWPSRTRRWERPATSRAGLPRSRRRSRARSS